MDKLIIQKISNMLTLRKINRLPFMSFILLMLVMSCNNESANRLESFVKAPEFKLNTLEDEVISLSDYSGKYLVIHIATTWCPYCNAEMPHLEQLYQDYKDRDVEVLVIDVKEPKALVDEKLKQRFAMQVPIVLDLDGAVAGSFAPIDVLPDLSRDEVMLASNIVIDPDGQIIFMSLLDTKNFDTELVEIKQLLDEVL